MLSKCALHSQAIEPLENISLATSLSVYMQAVVTAQSYKVYVSDA
jgi:hypothetical protein